MNKRLRLTIFNWRWYVAIPIAILALPIILLDGVLLVLWWIGENGHEAIDNIPAYMFKQWVQREGCDEATARSRGEIGTTK